MDSRSIPAYFRKIRVAIFQRSWNKNGRRSYYSSFLLTRKYGRRTTCRVPSTSKLRPSNIVIVIALSTCSAISERWFCPDDLKTFEKAGIGCNRHIFSSLVCWVLSPLKVFSYVPRPYSCGFMSGSRLGQPMREAKNIRRQGRAGCHRSGVIPRERICYPVLRFASTGYFDQYFNHVAKGYYIEPANESSDFVY